MSPRGVLIAAFFGALVGLLASFLGPRVHRTSAILEVEESRELGIPPLRYTNLLRRSMKSRSEVEAFGECLRGTTSDEADATPEPAGSLREPLEPWLEDLAVSGFDAKPEDAFSSQIWSLSIRFTEGSGYAVTLYHHDPERAAALLEVTTSTLECWVSHFNREEPVRRHERLAAEWRKIEEFLKRSAVPAEDDLSVDLDLERVSADIDALELAESLDPLEWAQGDSPNVELARLDRLLAATSDRSSQERIEELREQVLGIVEAMAIREAFLEAQAGAAETLVLSAYRVTFHSAERLPMPSGDSRITAETELLRAWPPLNAAIGGIVLASLIAMAWRFVRRQAP